jgi:hypothetical protein
MEFRNPMVETPCITDPASCQAVQIDAALGKAIEHSTASREENQLKRLKYERERSVIRYYRHHANTHL